MKINNELLNVVLDKSQERLIMNKNFSLAKLLDEDLLKAYTRLIKEYKAQDDVDDLIIEIVDEMVDRGLSVPVL